MVVNETRIPLRLRPRGITSAHFLVIQPHEALAPRGSPVNYLLSVFVRDERGSRTMDWIFVASILTLGTIAGLLALWHADLVR